MTLSVVRLALIAVGLSAIVGPTVVAAAPPAGADFEPVVAELLPSVVTIETEVDGHSAAGFFGESFGGVARGSGSGFVIEADGVILTNAHVVEGATRIEVELHDGRRFIARLLGSDETTDIAALQIQAKGLRPVRFGDSDAAKPGQWVAAIGAPFGLRQTVTVGVISATKRTAGSSTEHLQTDAIIHPGNSGGPLVDRSGAVLGVSSRILSGATGIGFAVASNIARRVASQLRAQGRVSRGWIGADAQSLTHAIAQHLGRSNNDGVLISSVTAKSPAAAGRLTPGDVVLTLDGVPLTSAEHFERVIAESAPGRELKISIWRGGKAYAGSVKVAPEPAASERAKAASTATYPDRELLGMGVREASQDLREETGYRGTGTVIIVRIAPASPADRAGLYPGLAVLRADGARVERPRDLLQALADKAALLLLEDSEGDTGFVLVTAK
jgi:serine protease Do